jgi:hypothetical protein
MTNHFLLARDGLPLKITKRTQGGHMTHRFFARDGLPLNPCQKLRNEPKPSDPDVLQGHELAHYAGPIALFVLKAGEDSVPRYPVEIIAHGADHFLVDIGYYYIE